MSDIAIRVDGLGKRYHLGGQQERYHTFAEQIKKWTSLRRLYSRAKRAEAKPPFWAIKDVSFEVKRGEVVGIIGRNGAGKSTLLKILSRITEPTEGEATIYGRVGSLLEVGTGFHPELTGRENIFLNGAILGMKRAEIVRKFDEIVSFAEVEKFIDTPTKHYSSGMYTRLAFAVAANLEPEILVVDEVLAVGDAHFQQKCLGKMGEVARGGRTVLFVSHNMTAINSFCNRGVYLQGGRIEFSGHATDAAAKYLSATSNDGELNWNGIQGDQDVRLRHTSVVSKGKGRFNTDDQLVINVTYEVLRPVWGLVCGVEISNQFEQRLVYSAIDDALPPPIPEVQPGIYNWMLIIPPNTFAKGTYRIYVDLGIHKIRRIVHDVGRLTFTLENVTGIGRRFVGHDNVLRPSWKWVQVDS